MSPGRGAIEDATFAGGTRFDEGTLRATAADGRYQIAKGMLELTGSEGNADPRVQDERITVDADAHRPDASRARGWWRPARCGALLQAGRRRRRRARTRRIATAKAARVPGMLKDDQPGQRDRRRASTTTAATRWRPTPAAPASGRTTRPSTARRSSSTSKSGDLKANGGAGQVRSTFTLEQVNAKTQAKETGTVDRDRRRTCTTRTPCGARPTRPTRTSTGRRATVTAVKIELYLAESGNELERAEAYQQVKLLAESRVGDRRPHDLLRADERYVMTGAPVKTIVEECRETTGKTLTFCKIDR